MGAVPVPARSLLSASCTKAACFGGSLQPVPSLRLPDLSWLSHGADVHVLMLPMCKNAKKLLGQTQ